MATKMFINHANDTVSECLSGFCSAYPRLDYHASNGVVLENNWHQRGNKVAIVCGGGSGHEPFAAAGVLVVIPNYTGDCLNFGIAIEDAKQDGLKIADVIVGDDCSIPIEEQGRAGKRGLVGLLFVNKIAGSLAQAGKTLDEITREIQNVAQNIATYGVGFSACSMPGRGPMFEIPRDEIEIGLGVHGEAGYKRIKWREASKIVEIQVNRIIESLSLFEGCSVAVIVNNFGASSQLEQGIVVHEVVKQLKIRGIRPLRVYFGSLMTSLGSAGMHVSILHLTDEKLSVFVECLDDETEAPCWPGSSCSVPLDERPTIHIDEKSRKDARLCGGKLNDERAKLMGDCLKNVCLRIVENEENINKLDSGCGDGDCGFTHRKLAEGILSSLVGLNVAYPASLMMQISCIAEDQMGGTSGAIYSILFKAASSELAKYQKNEDWRCVWLRVWKRGIAAVGKYGKARSGDRTMLDALIPACTALEENASSPIGEIAEKVTKAAWSGCKATRNMKPMTGRASYVKQGQYLNDVDAGSFAVAIWINAVAETIAKSQ